MTTTTILSDNGVSSGSAGIKTTGGNDGTLALQTTTAGGAATTAVTIDTSQNVGIGTTSPSSKLYTQLSSATAYSSGVTGNGLTIYNSSATTNQYVGITLQGEPTTGNGGIATIMGTTTGSGNMDLTFSTRGSATLAERMRIDSSGNVGIGTTSANGILNVTNSGTSTIYATNSAAAASGDTGLLIATNAVDSDCQIRLSKVGATLKYAWIGPGTSTPLIFATAAAERMRIDTSGFVFVGCTATPSSSVSGVRIGNPSSGATITSCGATTTSVTHNIFTNGNGQVGSISTNASATAFTTSSDYRLKEDIAPMTGALAKVSALKPVTYKWKVDGNNGEGFIAHELADVCPHAVIGEKDAVDADGNPVYQGIDVSFLVATLTAAIQEQQALITALTARIETLENKT